MHEWKSKRIQYRRLQCNRLIRLFLISCFQFISIFIFAQSQNNSNLPTIKQSPTERIHSLEISQVNGLSEKSIPEYIELLAFPETQELANFRLANIYANMGNWPKAEIYATAARELNPMNSDYDYLIIRILEKQFQYEKSWQIHRKLIAQQPRFISRYYDAMSNCVKRENYTDALELIKQYQFQFGLNEYAHRIQMQCYLFLDLKSPKQKFLDSLLILNEQYLITKPKEFTPWVAFQINQIQKKMGETESKETVISFYQRMRELQQFDSSILEELDKLSHEFPALRSTSLNKNIFKYFDELRTLNKGQSAEPIFNDFENQIQDTNITLSDLDSLYNVLLKIADFAYKPEALVLLGNQYFTRGYFDKALICLNYWRENEPRESPFFIELTSPKTENSSTVIPHDINESNKSINPQNKLKNDLLSIQCRYIICLYKMEKTRELRAELEWYELNFPFIIEDATTLIRILELQLNKNWVDPVNLWSQIKMESPIYNESYFAQIDLQINSPNKIEPFKSSPLHNCIMQWQNQGKIHPTMARDLINLMYPSRKTNN